MRKILLFLCFIVFGITNISCSSPITDPNCVSNTHRYQHGQNQHDEFWCNYQCSDILHCNNYQDGSHHESIDDFINGQTHNHMYRHRYRHRYDFCEPCEDITPVIEEMPVQVQLITNPEPTPGILLLVGLLWFVWRHREYQYKNRIKK